MRDAEAYEEILFTIERYGSALTGKIGTLWDYGPAIKARAECSPLAEDIPRKHRDWHVPFSELYEVVRDARNDALHQGAFARHLTRHAIQLILVLEDTLNDKANTVGDFMVRDPVCTYPWQPVSFVRQQMLANNFTYLPIWDRKIGEPEWRLISDRAVATYLRSAHGNKERKTRLATTVEDAVATDALELEKVRCHHSGTSVEEIIDTLDHSPVLITDRDYHERLVGILTPFDLL